MAIGKQFDEEMGYAASREIPAAVAQYMKATGKSEEQVAKEIINEDPEWLDWTTHTNYPGNSTPEDNGWTDLKKLGLGIANSWEDHRNNTDPMWRVGLVNAMFGDPSMLGQYYQMQNQNAENEKNRKEQYEYNSMFKELEETQKKKEQIALDRKRALEILDKGEAASPVEKLELEQILDKYEHDELQLTDLQTRAEAELTKRKEDEAKAEEERLVKEEEDRKKAVVAESFIAQIPYSFKDDASKKSWINKHKQEIEALPIEYQQRAWSKLGGQTQSEKDRETYHNADIHQGIQESNEKKQARQEYNLLKAKPFRSSAENKRMAELKAKYNFK